MSFISSHAIMFCLWRPAARTSVAEISLPTWRSKKTPKWNIFFNKPGADFKPSLHPRSSVILDFREEPITSQDGWNQALTDEPEQSASERSRENAGYERYCFDQVTCNMNAIGRTWNGHISTVTRPKRRSPIWKLIEVEPWVVEWNKQTKQARVLQCKS